MVADQWVPTLIGPSGRPAPPSAIGCGPATVSAAHWTGGTYAREVVEVFETLYVAWWPICGMRLVDAYGGSDARSAHAYGAAIDLNPVRNPDLRGSRVSPPAGRAFATLDRSADAVVPAHVAAPCRDC